MSTIKIEIQTISFWSMKSYLFSFRFILLKLQHQITQTKRSLHTQGLASTIKSTAMIVATTTARTPTPTPTIARTTRILRMLVTAIALTVNQKRNCQQVAALHQSKRRMTQSSMGCWMVHAYTVQCELQKRKCHIYGRHTAKTCRVIQYFRVLV